MIDEKEERKKLKKLKKVSRKKLRTMIAKLMGKKDLNEKEALIAFEITERYKGDKN